LLAVRTRIVCARYNACAYEKARQTHFTVWTIAFLGEIGLLN